MLIPSYSAFLRFSDFAWRATLGELQERDRNIFLQRYWFATPIKEISKKYAMNLNTVKASLFRSRNKLKALLEKEGVLL